MLMKRRKAGNYEKLDKARASSSSGESAYEYFAYGLKSYYNVQAGFYKDIEGYNTKVIDARYSEADKSLLNSQYDHFDHARKFITDIEHKIDYIKDIGRPEDSEKASKYDVEYGPYRL